QRSSSSASRMTSTSEQKPTEGRKMRSFIRKLPGNSALMAMSANVHRPKNSQFVISVHLDDRNIVKILEVGDRLDIDDLPQLIVQRFYFFHRSDEQSAGINSAFAAGHDLHAFL